jgi:hypothetical protein
MNCKHKREDRRDCDVFEIVQRCIAHRLHCRNDCERRNRREIKGVSVGLCLCRRFRRKNPARAGLVLDHNWLTEAP